MSGEYCCLIVYGSAACFPDYNDMADNKAYLESVARSFGYFWKGQKVELILFPNHQRLQGRSSC
jgi:enoyl-[acyl-carrier protein] reductase I